MTGTKTGFYIDDPSDPSTLSLAHTPVDTDELVVMYSGNVRTGDDGRAKVDMPYYADLVAGDWRYTLTPVGAFGQAMIERPMRDGRFVIRTEHPNMNVSWSVIGVRDDPYAASNPFEPVRLKSGIEAGRLVHPEAVGEPGGHGLALKPPATTRRAALRSAGPARRGR